MSRKGATRRSKIVEQDDVPRTRVIKEKFIEQRKVPPLQARNDTQRKAFQAMSSKQLIVLEGAAGGGKTEIGTWHSAKRFLEGSVDTIVVTRPLKSLGGDLGALPGNATLKLLPTCLSILTKFKKWLGVNVLKNKFQMLDEEDLFSDVSGITIIPIELMQGRSFNDRTIIVADEMQTSTIGQMKSI